MTDEEIYLTWIELTEWIWFHNNDDIGQPEGAD